MKYLLTPFYYCCLAMCVVSYSNAQCEIDNLVFSLGMCEVGKFNVELDFDFANTSDSFEVVGNGMNHGTWGYDQLPVVIFELEGDCDTEYEFVVRDQDEPDCNDFVVVGEVCCHCELWDFVVEESSCDEGIFSIDIDFNYENIGHTGQFELKGNGTNYGVFLYEDLPITIDGLEGDCETAYEFVICDVDFPDCRVDYDLGEICCEEECEISELSFDILECNGDSCVVVRIDFEHSGTGGVGFDVFDRTGHIGFYAYSSLPLVIECYPISGRDFEFVRVCDNDNPDCCAVAEVEALDCAESCSIRDLEVEVVECDSNRAYYIALDFISEMTGDSGWIFKLNDSIYGNFAYDSFPNRFGPFYGGCDTVVNVKIYDALNVMCADSSILENPCCEEDECDIRDFTAEVVECDTNHVFYLSLDFIHENASDTGFALKVDGEIFDQYKYEDLPILAGPFDGGCDVAYGVQVCDLLHAECEATLEIIEPCCEEEECEISELSFDILECNGDSCIVVRIDFEHSGTGGVGFDVFDRTGHIGFYAYSSLPLVIECYPISGRDFEFVRVCDNDNPDCCADAEAEALDCEENECDIRDFTAEVVECDTNHVFYLRLDFIHENASDTGFALKVDGEIFDQYKYEDLPILAGPFDGGCDVAYGVQVCDLLHAECEATLEIIEPCCEEEECEISELSFDILECNGDSCVVVRIDFEHSGTGGVGFDVFDRTGHIGFYAYSSLPLVIECYPISGRDFEFVRVCDNDNPDCCADAEAEALDCEENECDIRDFTAEVVECDTNHVFYLRLDFIHENASDTGFALKIDGDIFDQYKYEDLPILAGPFDGGCDVAYGVQVCDLLHGECEATLEIIEPCCEEEECEISELSFEVLECNGDSCVVVRIDFEHSGTGGVGFDVFDRTGHIGFYAYSSLPLVIECYPISGRDFEFVRVCDNDNLDCCADAEAEALDCTTSTTNIQEAGWNVFFDWPNSTIVGLTDGDLRSPIFIEVIDMNGRKVKEWQKVGEFTEDVSGLTSGVYILHLRTNQSSGIVKIMIP